MTRLDCITVLVATTLIAASPGTAAQAQHHGEHSPAPESSHASPSPNPETILHAPGQAVFGTVQEAIRQLEADSTTDWSQVDVDRLHQHLLDMHHVAVNVVVEQKTPIENGLRLRVRPSNDAARASLDRVLDAHPHMLKQETGWTLEVEEQENAYVLRVTTGDPDEIAKIRALGYMGLLAYGQHHQRHHWHLVKGQHPHHSEGQ